MKRSTCLSALLLALASSVALTTAPDALGAPKGAVKGAKKPKKAKGPPAEPAPEAAPAPAPAPDTSSPSTEAAQSDAPAPAAPAAQTDGNSSTTTAPAAPGDSTATQPQPAVTVGTGSGSATPGTDSPQTAPATPAEKPKPRPFAGSAIYTTTSMTTATVFRGQQQDPNSTVESAFWFLPRYAINEAFQVRARAIVNYEYTNSESTRYRNEPILSDTTVQLFYRKIPEIATIKPQVYVQVGAPTSKASRARTMLFAPGVGLQLRKGFEKAVGGGDIELIGTAIFSHPIYQSQTAQVVDGRPEGSLQCVGGLGDCNNLSAGGTQNSANILSYFMLVEGQWGKWNPALYYLGSSQWLYAPKEVSYNDIVPGSGDGRVTSGQPSGGSGTRQTHYFSTWLDYNFNSWFTGEVGYWLSRTTFNEAGKYGNPFWDRYQDMRVYLGASIQLDNLVKTIQGGSEGEAGVVRAKNSKQPMWNF